MVLSRSLLATQILIVFFHNQICYKAIINRKNMIKYSHAKAEFGERLQQTNTIINGCGKWRESADN